LDLAPYIRELILLNECVILPNFGGFETQYSAAQYDSVHKRMLPPTKKVRFRSDYQKGGDVLEDHLCKHLHIKKDKAALIIEKYVKALNEQIEERREAIIEGVGLFTKGLGNSLNFMAFEEENYLADSYGLEALPYEEKHIEKIIEPYELKIRPRRNTLTIVAVGIGVIFLLLVLTIFISSKFDLYLFNIGDRNNQNDLLIIGNQFVQTDSTARQLDNTIVESTHLKKALFYSETQSKELHQDITSFYLVAGSFKTLRNAEISQQELVKEGFLPDIIKNQGFYRVSIGNYTDKQEALQELQRFRRQINRSVWLLEVKNQTD
jgi:hypothetical protein